ncbi:2Fe-2S ferredoxin-type iron-sulfur binding domain protein [Acididesulfobacillus acetoxydans]|uniref:2Fe-2S ferredoxin-type iron-sulfur binding domain protein n=1 Tax=Acididesulfobacillus acetoxydans TaxID=1561005 RepID=A0A8S0XXD4_9FIRM|nr:ASKHA domain-containing protein [Acididesulfobacillus acetoxydans]CAA7601657.1 2Fe-2S ferredoxin-type iron-sulfur binding domain protein [Acididesulfobacillus acetoxydans]CEJ06323.1 2Fe-2S iron-sulfur cluster binding domain protein [Acididesulfobacillus acetoxydans]
MEKMPGMEKMPDMEKGVHYQVTFLPDKIQMKVPAGMSVLAAAAEAGVELEGPCGGKGTCGKCRVKLVEEKGEEWVRACQTPVNRDLMVEIPQAEVSVQRKSDLSRRAVPVDLASGIEKVKLKVTPPSLEHQVADADRFLSALDREDVKLSLEALRALPRALRRADGLVSAVLCEDEVLTVEAGDTTERLYGLAVDIGTTTVVAALVDLRQGETLATASASNTQNIFGADVIARIEHATQKAKGLEQLQQRILQVIRKLVARLAAETGVKEEEIYQVTVVGNTTMSHLFLAVDPANLAPSPFIPGFSRMVSLKAKELGLNTAPQAQVYVLPNIAGYVGADTVGVILATELDKKEGVNLAVDIGTNGEIVLAAHGKIWSCSTAAGPAFEGAQIEFGMRAATGAIEKVKITDEGLQLQVIGDSEPKGICGSGLLDLVAELVRTGIVEESGRMLGAEEGDDLPPVLRQRLSRAGSGNSFVLAEAGAGRKDDVVLTQKDVRELQLAKAAMRAGIEILLSTAGIRYHDLDQVLLAGAFGNYVDKYSALAMGLLPPVAAEKIQSVGNAAGAGAQLALISRSVREHSMEIARKVVHVELSSRSDFQDKFVDALSLTQGL